MIRRVLTEAANTRIGLAVVRLFARPKGLFLCYPVEQRFADHYCTLARQAKITWTPYLVGWMKQGDAVSLLFTISANESHFLQSQNAPHLSNVHNRMLMLQQYFYASQLSYAGILPTVMRSKRVLKSSSEANITCIAIRDAILKIISGQSNYPSSITVLGGRGFIGCRLVAALKSTDNLPLHLKKNIVVVDKGDVINSDQSSLFLNCSLPGVIESIAEQIPAGSIVINEVYPAPMTDTVKLLKVRGVRVYHIAGVKGYAVPNFPEEYSGAIPCCAALQHLPIQVVIKSLTFGDA